MCTYQSYHLMMHLILMKRMNLHRLLSALLQASLVDHSHLSMYLMAFNMAGMPYLRELGVQYDGPIIHVKLRVERLSSFKAIEFVASINLEVVCRLDFKYTWRLCCVCYRR